MSKPESLEARVAALETEVGELKERVRYTQHDAAAARVLAGGADRDVSEIRAEIRDFRQATTSSFNAMREDLSDFKQSVGDRFAEVRAGHEQIVGLLTTIIDQQGGQPGDR